VTVEGIGGESAWWCPSLDDAGNGTSTLNDISGNGFDATLTDMDPSTDWPLDTDFGGVRAIDFDGEDDLLVVDDPLFGADTTQLSMAVWIRRPTASTLGPFYGLGNGTTTNRIEIQPWSDNQIYVTFTSFIYGYIALDEDWHHYAVLYDGSQTGNANRLKLYKDGVEQSVTFAGEIPAALGAASLVPRFGRSHPGSYGAGRIDDARAYSRLISPTEIAHLASARGVTGLPAKTIDFDKTLDDVSIVCEMTGTIPEGAAVVDADIQIGDIAITAEAHIPERSVDFELTIGDIAFDASVETANNVDADIQIGDIELTAFAALWGEVNADIQIADVGINANMLLDDFNEIDVALTVGDVQIDATAATGLSMFVDFAVGDVAIQSAAIVGNRRSRGLFPGGLQSRSVHRLMY